MLGFLYFLFYFCNLNNCHLPPAPPPPSKPQRAPCPSSPDPVPFHPSFRAHRPEIPAPASAAVSPCPSVPIRAPRPNSSEPDCWSHRGQARLFAPLTGLRRHAWLGISIIMDALYRNIGKTLVDRHLAGLRVSEPFHGLGLRERARSARLRAWARGPGPRAGSWPRPRNNNNSPGHAASNALDSDPCLCSTTCSKGQAISFYPPKHAGASEGLHVGTSSRVRHFSRQCVLAPAPESDPGAISSVGGRRPEIHQR